MDNTKPSPTPKDSSIQKEENTGKPAEASTPKRLDPTRYGDWEKAGRCIDF